MHQFSDSDTTDSDEGRRFKTETTRPKQDLPKRSSPRRRSSPPPPRKRNYEDHHRRRSRSRSHDRHNRRRRLEDERRSRSRHEDRTRDERRSSRGDRDRRDKEETLSKQSKRSPDEKSDRKSKENGEKLRRREKSSDSYGPVLPPVVTNKKKVDEIDDKKDGGAYGPSLPPSFSRENGSDSPEKKEPEKESIPTSEETKEKHKSIGPDLPDHLREQLAKSSENVTSFDDGHEEDEDNMIGPLPPEMGLSKAQIALEERAIQMKIDRLSKDKEDATKREEWMTELPAVKSIGLGLGPRQFRANPGPDLSDRSSWTDTPEDKLKKQSGKSKEEVDLKKEAELMHVKKRDEEQEKIIKKHKKQSRRDESSLLQMHQANMKKKKQDGEKTERRPFNREIDLKVNRFDEAQKKAVLKKAQLLDDRFSSGQAKYL